jgi:hypothetical protein
MRSDVQAAQFFDERLRIVTMVSTLERGRRRPSKKKGKSCRPCDLDQLYLLPFSLLDWLPEDHLTRFIAEVSRELDLQPVYAVYEQHDARGHAAYDPRMMVRLLLY